MSDYLKDIQQAMHALLDAKRCVIQVQDVVHHDPPPYGEKPKAKKTRRRVAVVIAKSIALFPGGSLTCKDDEEAKTVAQALTTEIQAIVKKFIIQQAKITRNQLKSADTLEALKVIQQRFYDLGKVSQFSFVASAKKVIPNSPGGEQGLVLVLPIEQAKAAETVAQLVNALDEVLNPHRDRIIKQAREDISRATDKLGE